MMGLITNDDRDGNWMVEFYGPKKCVARFQTRSLDDAKEAAWQHYRSRNNSTARITTKVLIGPLHKIGKRFYLKGDRDILIQLRERWDVLWQQEPPR